MFLKERANGHLIEVVDLSALIDPNDIDLQGCSQYGEEAQDPESYLKTELVFLSGEPLPRCWTDPHYRDDELKRRF